RALLLNIPGVALLLLLSVLSGVILFAVYGKCDPRLKGDITRADQLMPYIAQDLLGDYPGLCGVLVAAVYSGCLSSLSSGFNAMAAVTWDDFIRPCVRLPEKRTVLLTKCIGRQQSRRCYGGTTLQRLPSGLFLSLLQKEGGADWHDHWHRSIHMVRSGLIPAPQPQQLLAHLDDRLHEFQ
ncbi:unnamed protein product, partial [Ixodes pacificus]